MHRVVCCCCYFPFQFKLKCFAMNFPWKFLSSVWRGAPLKPSSLYSYNWIWSINGIFSHYSDQIIASYFDFSRERMTKLHDTFYFSAGSLFLCFFKTIFIAFYERNVALMRFLLPFVFDSSFSLHVLLLRRHTTSPQLQIRLYTKFKDVWQVLGCRFGRKCFDIYLAILKIWYGHKGN